MAPEGTAGADEGHTCLSQDMGSMVIDQDWVASQGDSPAEEDQASETETNPMADIPLTAKRKRGRPPGKVKSCGRPLDLIGCKKMSKGESAAEFLKCKLCSGPPFRPALAAHMNNRHSGARLNAESVKQLNQLHRAA